MLPAAAGACFFRPGSCGKCVTISPTSRPSPRGLGSRSAGRLLSKTTNSHLTGRLPSRHRRTSRPFQRPRLRRRAAHTRPPRLPRYSRTNRVWFASAHSRRIPPHRARSQNTALRSRRLRPPRLLEEVRKIELITFAASNPEMGWQNRTKPRRRRFDFGDRPGNVKGGVHGCREIDPPRTDSIFTRRPSAAG